MPDHGGGVEKPDHRHRHLLCARRERPRRRRAAEQRYEVTPFNSITSSAEHADTIIAAAAISIRVAPAYGKPLQVEGSSVNSASRRSAVGAGTTCCKARRAVARLPFG